VLSVQHIRSICSGGLSISEPLAPLTSFRIGGPVDIYVEPANAEELVALLEYFRSVALPTVVLGNGSNILIADEGIRGVVISIEKGFSTLEYRDGIVHAGGGVRLSKFVDFCIAQGKAGTEMLAGIPGTLGGGIIMNAGAYGGEISDHLLDVRLCRDGALLTLPRERCGFAYRTSTLTADIVLGARFRLPDGEGDALRARRKELLLKRNAAQPVNLPNAGSIFKNPEGDYAARLIESCALKGTQIGGARVAELHANFIVNTGGATAADVVALINHVRRAVFDRHGVALELEIRLLGFAPDVIHPLH